MKKISLGLFLPLLFLNVSLLLSVCGKKGPPVAPTGSTYTYPQPYPAEE